MISTSWLIFIGILYHSSFYCLSRLYVAKWICRALLGPKVQFKTASRSENEVKSTSNGSTQSQSVDGPVRMLTKGDLAEVAQLTVGLVFACIASVMGALVMYQSKDSVIYEQSWLLVPFTHFGVWYYVVDCYTMFQAYRMRRHTSQPLCTAVCGFLTRRWIIIGHHLLVLCVAYPVISSYSLRGGKGDFVAGALIIQDLSTPFLSTVKILRLLGLEQTVIYRITGIALLVTFFLVRVAILPLVTLLYAAQHHSWDLYTALSSMTPVCHCLNSLQLLLQTYWFLSLLRIAAGSQGKTHKHK